MRICVTILAAPLRRRGAVLYPINLSISLPFNSHPDGNIAHWRQATALERALTHLWRTLRVAGILRPGR
jgi:hypothetical protein